LQSQTDEIKFNWLIQNKKEIFPRNRIDYFHEDKSNFD